MSWVTNILITCGVGEEDGDDKFPPIDRVNEWLLANGQHAGLSHLNGHEGGHKAWEVDVFGGAFNYLPIEDFIKAVAAAKWDQPDRVQVWIMGQEEEVFGLLHLVSPQESRLGSEETRKARKALGRSEEDEPW